MGTTLDIRPLLARLGASAAALVMTAGAASAAGPMDRLKGVAEHARERATGGPDHLWTGIAIGVIVAVVIAAAAWATLRRKK